MDVPPEGHELIINREGRVTGTHKFKELEDEDNREPERDSGDDRDDIRVRSRRSLEQSDRNGD